MLRPFGTQASLVNGNLSIKPQYQFATINLAGMSAPFYKLEPGFGNTPPSETKEIKTPSAAKPSKQ